MRDRDLAIGIANPAANLTRDKNVGWVEQRETHHIEQLLMMGSAIASTHPTLSRVKFLAANPTLIRFPTEVTY